MRLEHEAVDVREKAIAQAKSGSGGCGDLLPDVGLLGNGAERVVVACERVEGA